VAIIGFLSVIKGTALVGSLGPAANVTNAKVAYLGCGCFWHVQHEMVHFEEKSLGRNGVNLTTFTGYAGGKSVGADGRVCYHNFEGVADYGQMGYAEVVSVALPDATAATKIAKKFFGEICPGGMRDDPQDIGAEYRPLAGFPGGIDSPEGSAFAAEGLQQGVNVVAGNGNDPDTPGTVYVMDTRKFPFHQAELYHQFHDDMIDTYSGKYHDLIGTLRSSGAIHATGCPSDGISTTRRLSAKVTA